MITPVDTLRSLQIPEGRRLYREYFNDRLLRNARMLQTLIDCWKLAVRGIDLQFSDGRSFRFETHLGRRFGTRLFLEEVLSRYYYNTIQGWVYVSAVFLIVGVGLNLAGYDFRIALAGFAMQAFFLLLLAIVTAYGPMEDAAASPEAAGMNENQFIALNRAVHDMTNAVSDLFRLISQTDFRQDVLLSKLTENQAKITAAGTAQFIETLQETNTILADLRTHFAPGVPHPSTPIDAPADSTDKLQEFLSRTRPGQGESDAKLPG